jgi:hypothetical protein
MTQSGRCGSLIFETHSIECHIAIDFLITFKEAASLNAHEGARSGIAQQLFSETRLQHQKKAYVVYG